MTSVERGLTCSGNQLSSEYQLSTCCIQSGIFLVLGGATSLGILSFPFTQPWRGRGGDGGTIYLWVLKKEGAGSPVELTALVSPFCACLRILLRVPRAPAPRQCSHFTVSLPLPLVT